MLKRISSVIVLCLAMATQLLAQTEGQKTHEVQAGETLYSLARANGVTVEDIQKANPSMDILKTGMVIILPAPKPNQPTLQAHSRRSPTAAPPTSLRRKRRSIASAANSGLIWTSSWPLTLILPRRR